MLPGNFAGAEHYHLAVKLDRWVVSTALDWLSDNPDHLRNLSLCSINLSGLSGATFRCWTIWRERLKHQRNLSGKLCFEVTETAAIANFNNAPHFIGTEAHSVAASPRRLWQRSVVLLISRKLPADFQDRWCS